MPESGFQGHNSQDPEYCDSPGIKDHSVFFCCNNVLFVVFGSNDSKRGKMLSSDFVRRSSRRVKVRGEREFVVNSDMKLRDFKVKVFLSLKL